MHPLPGRSVVAEYGSRFDADLAVARLREAGLESSVLGDPAHSIAPHHVTERVFRLVVRDEIVDHARDVLDDPRVDAESEALDAAFHQRRFSDRPSWVRWTTVALLVVFVGPIAIAVIMQLLWITRGLFP